ncbi:hypothetical protein ACQJBY_024432 [Aegilops geniculata]
MDAAGTSKRGRRPPNKKLKFKPKVPSRKPKKPLAQKPQLEETKPIDEELMKTLRTGRGDAKTLRVIKDEQSAQNSDSKTLSSAAGVSFQAAQSGKQKQPKNSQALQIPRAFPANPGSTVMKMTRMKMMIMLFEKMTMMLSYRSLSQAQPNVNLPSIQRKSSICSNTTTRQGCSYSSCRNLFLCSEHHPL